MSVDRLRDAAVGDVLDVNTGHALEKLHRHMRRGPESGRAVGELARLAFGESDVVLHGLGAYRGMNDQRLRQDNKLRDRSKHLGNVVRHALAYDMHRCRGARRQVERMAVGRRMDHRIHPDQGSAARPVIDHKLLAQDRRKVLGREPGKQVAAATGSSRNNNADGTVGIILLRSHRAREDAKSGQSQ
jgi:hypothetical protein